MAKRKLGASIIILLIAAITLISGTYAWFLVGGFASLFDIGFDVIESKGGILLQGDAGTAEKGTTDWGTSLERVDFTEKSFIAEGGKYKPVSSVDAVQFLKVDLKNDEFTCGGIAPNKTTAEATDICYNDFSFKVKSDGSEIPGDDNSGAYVQIELTGEKLKEDGTTETDEEKPEGAAVAARVSIKVDGTTTIYSLDGKSYNAVTNNFSGTIYDADDASTETKKGNRIIDSADTNYTDAGLQTPANYKALKADDKFIKIYLGTVSATPKDVEVKVWLEGNDKDCVDFAKNTVAGKSLMTKMTFGIDE